MLQLRAAVVGVKATPKGVRGLTRCLWHRPATGSLAEGAGMRMDGRLEAAAAATAGSGLEHQVGSARGEWGSKEKTGRRSFNGRTRPNDLHRFRAALCSLLQCATKAVWPKPASPMGISSCKHSQRCEQRLFMMAAEQVSRLVVGVGEELAAQSLAAGSSDCRQQRLL